MKGTMDIFFEAGDVYGLPVQLARVNSEPDTFRLKVSACHARLDKAQAQALVDAMSDWIKSA